MTDSSVDHSPRDSLVPFLPQPPSRRSCDAMNQIMEDQRGGCGEIQVSVSFGRFEKDSLSWEKWSAFSPNKYLEEVEKCSTPGSVARKAAYFEAHYKRIAARKAELLLLTSSASSEDIETSSREEGYHSIWKQEEEEEDQNEDDMITLEKERLSFEVVVGESIDGRCRRSEEETKDGGDFVKDELKEEEEGVPAVSGSHATDAAKRSVDDIIRREEVEDCEVTSANVEIGNAVQAEMSAKIREDAEKLESWRKPHKIDPLRKENIMEKAKKKPAPAVIKSPMIYSTPKTTSKPPTSISPAPPSTTKSLRKSGIMNVSTKRNNGGPAVNLKKVSPSNVCRPTTHSTPPSSNPNAIAAPRRSLIMERMGDKDIIKRAFKTFQNHVGLSKSFYTERSSAQKTAPAVTGDTNSTDSRKGNMGLNGRTVVKKSNEVLPSLYGSKSTERAEKRIQINKKPEQKSTAKEVEKSRPQSKTKEHRERDVKRLTQSIGFKATPMPSFYRGQNKPMVNKKEIQA